MLLINVIILFLMTIGLKLNLIVASLSSSLESSSNIQLLQQNGNEINLINGLSSDWINSTDTSNQVNYSSSWLIGDNLKCSLKLVTDYDSIDNGYNETNPINKLIVWFQNKDLPAIQLWMDSNERLDLFSKEYLIDLPLIRKNQFRLLINFQASRPFNYVPQLIKSIEIDRCWHTYQSCPVLLCSPNGSTNGVACSYRPDFSFNCSTLGLCIHRNEVCDFEINCPDGSDEVNCDAKPIAESTEILNSVVRDDDIDYLAIHNNSEIIGFRYSFRCSFESDYCFWKPTTTIKSPESCSSANCSHDRGLIRTMATNSLANGPTFDHTLTNSRGHYLFLRSTSKLGKSSGSIGSLTPIGGQCKLIFYYLTNSHSGQVLIRSSENSSTSNPFSTVEVVDLDWEKSLYSQVEVEIDLGASGEWLFLVAVIKGDENSYLAIDDIYFTEGCFPILNSSSSSSSTTTKSTVDTLSSTTTTPTFVPENVIN